MQVDNKWLFVGERYPDDDPVNFPPANGRNIMLPEQWSGTTMTIEWDASFGSTVVSPCETALVNEAGLTITNDARWYDDQNDELPSVDRGGDVSRHNGVYYWVSTDPDMPANGGDVYLYASLTLGSDSWVSRGKVLDKTPGNSTFSPHLFRSPRSHKYTLVTRGQGLDFYQSANKDPAGPYTFNRAYTSGELGGHTDHNVGDMSVFEDMGKLYIVISRRYTGDDPARAGERFTGVYEMDAWYGQVVGEVLWMQTDNREAPSVYRHNNNLVMTHSATQGWGPSKTYVRTASAIEGPWSGEAVVVSNPTSSDSYNTQHRGIFRVGDKWMYRGERHPIRDPAQFPADEGRTILIEIKWANGLPEQHWHDTWTSAADTKCPF
jgi:hypothetical protein